MVECVNVLLQAAGPWVSSRFSTCTGSSGHCTGNTILPGLTLYCYLFAEIHHLAKRCLDHLTTECAIALKSTVNSKQEKKQSPDREAASYPAGLILQISSNEKVYRASCLRPIKKARTPSNKAFTEVTPIYLGCQKVNTSADP